MFLTVDEISVDCDVLCDVRWVISYDLHSVVGEVTVTKLLRYVTSYFLKWPVTVSLHLK
jgi:hypothetical protein